MGAELSAGYCGEASAEVFLREVRAGRYPAPVVKRGRRQIWSREDLDRALAPHGDPAMLADVAEDL
jgi:hypothetical protein